MKKTKQLDVNKSKSNKGKLIFNVIIQLFVAISLLIITLNIIGNYISMQRCMKYQMVDSVYLFPNKVYCVKEVGKFKQINGEDVIVTQRIPIPIEEWEKITPPAGTMQTNNQ